jgi:hypothetical protein
METLNQIKIDENGSLSAIPYVYLCSEGKFTWLHGRNIQDRPITEQEWDLYRYWIKHACSLEAAYQRWADELFQQELADLEEGIIIRVGKEAWMAAPLGVQIIILNMSYNMGLTRFSPKKWPSFWGAFAIQNWERCAMEMMYSNGLSKNKLSDWYTDVDNPTDNYVGRGERLVTAMLSLA